MVIDYELEVTISIIPVLWGPESGELHQLKLSGKDLASVVCIQLSNSSGLPSLR